MGTSIKDDLRRKALEDLKNFDLELIKTKSKSLSTNLLTLLKSLNFQSKKIGVFIPMRTEPIWYLAFLEKPISGFFYAPEVSEKAMTFKEISLIHLVQNKMNWSVKLTSLEEKNLDAILIPGLLFTKNGGRLGRGKAFYDNYLKNYRGVRIGVCFEEQIKDFLPLEDHDELMNYIVTDKKIINCKGEI